MAMNDLSIFELYIVPSWSMEAGDRWHDATGLFRASMLDFGGVSAPRHVKIAQFQGQSRLSEQENQLRNGHGSCVRCPSRERGSGATSAWLSEGRLASSLLSRCELQADKEKEKESIACFLLRYC